MMRVRLIPALGAVLLFAIGVMSACGRGDGPLLAVQPPEPAPPEKPVSVLVTLDSASVAAGSAVRATATPRDARGAALIGRFAPQWSLEGSSGVATISQEGVITTVGAGVVVVVAQIDGVRGEQALDVFAPATGPAARVVVNLDTPTVAVGQTTQARVQAFDSTGHVLAGKSVTWSVASGVSVASVSSTGLVTAVSIGSAVLAGTVDSVVGSATLTVRDSAAASMVQLPRPLQDSVVVSYPGARRRTWTVKPSDNLQSVLNQAQRGDEVVIQAGATFTGNFTLPAKPGTAADGWILVRGDRQGALPPLGTRVGPAHAPLMPKLVTPNANAVLQTASGAGGWWITGLDLTIDPAFSSVNYGLVLLGDGSGKQNTLASVPGDLVLDRVYVHAHATVGTSRCVALNSARTAVINSYLDDCHLKGYDSQAIAGWNGPGPFRIENNALYGAGENVMFGGSDPAIAGLIPSDIILRRNHVYTPASWKSVWTKKNLLETKNVQRLVIEENVFDGSWGDAQVGFAFVLKSENQSGRCTWCASRDIVIRSNLIRNVGSGFNLAAREGSNPNPVGERMSRVLIDNNIMENIDVAPFSGTGSIVQVVNDVMHLTIRRNTFTSPSTSQGHFLNLGTNPAATSFSFTSNIVSYMKYGLFASGLGSGTPAMQALRSPVELRDVVVISAQRQANYPAGVTFVGSLAEARLFAGRGADETRVRAVAQLVAGS